MRVFNIFYILIYRVPVLVNDDSLRWSRSRILYDKRIHARLGLINDSKMFCTEIYTCYKGTISLNN